MGHRRFVLFTTGMALAAILGMALSGMLAPAGSHPLPTRSIVVAN